MCQCGEWSFLLSPCLNQGRSFCVPVPQELKGLFPLRNKVFGEKKRGRENECMIPASWNFPYSDSFVALDSGPWLSAHQLHLPEMQTGVFCGFWFCWVCSLVGYFCFVWLDFFLEKPSILCCLKILWCLLAIWYSSVSLDMIKKLTFNLPRWWDKTLVVLFKEQIP